VNATEIIIGTGLIFHELKELGGIGNEKSSALCPMWSFMADGFLERQLFFHGTWHFSYMLGEDDCLP
jgi:hypothetical protein